MGVVYEALGFATGHFGTVLRLAWLPVILLFMLQAMLAQSGVVPAGASLATNLRLQPGYTYQLVVGLLTYSPGMIIAMAIAVILQASYLVPLIRYAATGDSLPARSMHLAFGPRHLAYVVASAISFPFIVVLTQVALALAMRFVDGTIIPTLLLQHTTFEPGSLHAIETEPVFGGLTSFIRAIDGWLFSLGINLQVIDTTVALPILLVAVYLILRLMPLPYLVAARGMSGALGALRQTFAVSGGINTFRLIAIILVMGLLHFAFFALMYVGLIIFSFATAGSEALIVGFDGLLPAETTGPVVRGGLTALAGIIGIAVTAFLAGIQAGLGGAIAHRAYDG